MSVSRKGIKQWRKETYANNKNILMKNVFLLNTIYLIYYLILMYLIYVLNT